LLKHETFDLDLHETPELEALLGEAVAERRHLHSLPFSAVEQLTTASGRRWIYKTQRTPTFEPVRTLVVGCHRLHPPRRRGRRLGRVLN
jgi:hypothetical protein